jgi:hypothetical protein
MSARSHERESARARGRGRAEERARAQCGRQGWVDAPPDGDVGGAPLQAQEAHDRVQVARLVRAQRDQVAVRQAAAGKVEAEARDAAPQQRKRNHVGVHAAAGVAVAVHHARQLPLRLPPLARQVMAGDQPLPARVLQLWAWQRVSGRGRCARRALATRSRPRTAGLRARGAAAAGAVAAPRQRLVGPRSRAEGGTQPLAPRTPRAPGPHAPRRPCGSMAPRRRPRPPPHTPRPGRPAGPRSCTRCCEEAAESNFPRSPSC